MLGPIVLVVVFSFGSNALIGFPMGGLTLDWYRQLARATTDFIAPCWTASSSRAVDAVLSTLTGTLAALGLMNVIAPRCARACWPLLSLPVLLPPLVVAIAIVVCSCAALGIGLGLPVVVLGHILVTPALRHPHRDGEAGALRSVERRCGARSRRLALAAFRLVTLPQIASALIGAALVSAAISLDDFIIASFTIGGGNTLSTFVWGKMRTTLDPSINAIATILLVLTVGLSALALRLSKYKG